MNDTNTTTKPGVLAVMEAAVAQPNQYSTDDNGPHPASRRLVSASNPRWAAQTEQARQQDRDFTTTLARIGQSNPDRDAGLCAVQREHMRAGVEDVRIGRWIRGWYVRTDWADGERVFVGNGDDPTEAVTRALEWQAKAPDRRGIWMYGSDYFAAIAAFRGDA